MNATRKWGCAVAFAVICVLAVNFLLRFTGLDTPILATVTWDRVEIRSADGLVRPVEDPYQDQAALGLSPGEELLLTTRLPEAGEVPGLYADAYLLLEPGAGETHILLNGAEYFHCQAADLGQALNLQQLHLTLPPEAAGGELSIRFTPSGETGAVLSPLFARFSSESAYEAAAASYYNRSAISAGAYALAFVLVCAIFLLGLARGVPDWSLLSLALAASLTTAREIVTSSGYYFVSPAVYAFFLSEWAVLVPIALLVVYLLLNQRRSSWRYLGRIFLLTLAAAAVYYVYSEMTDGHFSSSLRYDFLGALRGSPHNLLALLNIYLLAACCGIAAYCLLQRAVRTHSEAKLLRMKNQLILDNYRIIEQNVQSAAALRHDLNNQFTALRLLYEKGDLEGLGRRLEELGQEVDRSSLPSFSDHFTVNILLQNAAAQAAQAGVRFQARPPLPQELPVEDWDLCSLLMNLLDNALSAAQRVEPPADRFVSVSLQVSQGFLAVSCRNSYVGDLALDETGWPQTTKADPEDHGFGLSQMEAVARKYASKLDLSYGGGVFTVQTALKLRP